MSIVFDTNEAKYRNLVHWNYYIALEQDLLKLSRFIEFSEANLKTYSTELAHLLLASSSEVDVVLKALCNKIDANTKHEDISTYYKTIDSKLPNLIDEECFMHRYGCNLKPWSEWKNRGKLSWWKSYNNVKHRRDECFIEANLKNTLDAMAALSLAILYYYREELYQGKGEFKDVLRIFDPKPSLISFNQNYYDTYLVAST